MKVSTAIKVFVFLLAIIFVGNQLVNSVYKPIKTETATYYTAVDGLNVSGVIIRNEILVENNSSGVLHFVVNDGSRVAKNGIIADIYDTDSASIIVSEISAIKNKIADIEDILSYNDIEAANLTLLNQKVNEEVNNVVKATNTGNYNELTPHLEELLSSINRRQAAMGEQVDFSAQLKGLNDRLAELNASLPGKKGSVNANESGYFVSYMDGYEDILKTKDLTSITPEFLKELNPKQEEKNYIGKIVSDYEWYIAASVTFDQSLSYKEGESLKLATNIKAMPELSATVKKINVSNEGDSAVIIFACNEMNSELASMRRGDFTVISSQHSGLRISRTAQRVVDGVRGVYVVSGMQIKFTPIEVVYSTEEYVLCEKNKEASLKLYDSVVVKGKNLYDGKIVG